MLTRREVLRAGLGVGAGAVALAAAPSLLSRTFADALAEDGPAGLTDIEHVVILIQENRSFDHYFGTLSGVRGFGDPNVLKQVDGSTVFEQIDPDLAVNQSGRILPFRLNHLTTSGQCAHGTSHAWSAQHGSWDNGSMDHFVAAHRIADGDLPPGNNAAEIMGYFRRDDIPYHYALADAFTVCDAYHCSVFGPTNPNRIMSMSGTVDPEGTMGGPCCDNGQSNGQLQWESYPERLQRAGIDWYVYQEINNDTNNMLPLFKGFNDTSTDLYRRGNTIIPTPAGQRYGPALAAKLKADVLSGNLPQVSYILASDPDCEHPNASPNYGARFVSSVLEAIWASPKVWAKTAVFYTFDENDGFFDHVPPPTAPPGTPGEYVSQQVAVQNAGSTDGFAGPVGLGFRVPMVVISPFSRGGLCSTETYDHTSLLLFLERRFGVEVANLSAWRRATVGDLTGAFDFASGRNTRLPALPDVSALVARTDAECAANPAPSIPSSQAIPVQDPGPKRRQPSGIVQPHGGGRGPSGKGDGARPAAHRGSFRPF